MNSFSIFPKPISHKHCDIETNCILPTEDFGETKQDSLIRMKSIGINIFCGIIWVLLCPYFPTLHLLSSFIVLPSVFFFSFYYFKPNVSAYIQIPINCLIILFIDFLFRKYAGGNHDQVGIALCDLNFFAILYTTTLSSIGILLISPSFNLKLPNNRLNVKNIFINSLFIVISTCVTYGLFYFLSYHK